MSSTNSKKNVANRVNILLFTSFILSADCVFSHSVDRFYEFYKWELSLEFPWNDKSLRQVDTQYAFKKYRSVLDGIEASHLENPIIVKNTVVEDYVISLMKPKFYEDFHGDKVIVEVEVLGVFHRSLIFIFSMENNQLVENYYIEK